MPASFDPTAYADCYALLDLALEKPQGIQKRFPAYNPAYDLRSRLNMARTVDKRMNKKLYEPGDPMHGSSIYMQLRLRIFAEKDEETGERWWTLQLLKVTPDLLMDDGWEEIGKEEEDDDANINESIHGVSGGG